MGDKNQNSTNRGRVCPGSWAKANHDPSALVDATDKPNCDEFAFASSYNSGGMAKSEGGLNPAVAIPGGTSADTPDGKNCVQTFTKKQGSYVHLYNIEGTKPSFYVDAQTGEPRYKEVCGRSAISGIHNQQSMGGQVRDLPEGHADHGQGRLLARHPHDPQLRLRRRARPADRTRHLQDDREVAA